MNTWIELSRTKLMVLSRVVLGKPSGDFQASLQVASSEQVQMVEQMIQFVEFYAITPARRQGPGLMVAGKEFLGKSAK